MTLSEWQQLALPRLRTASFTPSRHADVTIIAYTFPRPGQETESFNGIECAVLQTWRTLGMLPTVIVADRRFTALDAFLQKYSIVSLRIAPGLVPGNIRSMSLDCITHLKDTFTTSFCLVIQNDGFPLRDTLDEFLGRYDYIGAPANVSWWRTMLFQPLGLMTFNGGFSLRSRRICEAAAKEWSRWGHKIIRPSGRLFAEDVFYSTTAKINPAYRLRFRFPTLHKSLRFAYDDLTHRQDLPPPAAPFGFHGVTTAEHYLTEDLI